MTHEFKTQIAEVIHQALSGVGGRPCAEPLDDATLLHVPGGSGIAGTYQGREAILRLLEHLTDLVGGNLLFAPSRILTADDQMTVVFGHITANRQTKRLDTDTACVVLLRNGRASDIWLTNQDQANFDDFWC